MSTKNVFLVAGIRSIGVGLFLWCGSVEAHSGCGFKRTERFRTQAVYKYAALGLDETSLSEGDRGLGRKDNGNKLESVFRAFPRARELYQSDPEFFKDFLRGFDAFHSEAATAIHEATHKETEDHGIFHLASGEKVKIPKDIGTRYGRNITLAPKVIRSDFREYLADQPLSPLGEIVESYLSGEKATSGLEFEYLLNELNAYSVDIAAHLAMSKVFGQKEVGSSRDGFQLMMAALTSYVDHAKGADNQRTWQILNRPDVKSLVTKLWSQAHALLAASCEMKAAHPLHQGLLRKTYGGSGGMAQLTGLSLERPQACEQRLQLAETKKTSATSASSGRK